MKSKLVVVVVGATGKQGGAVARRLLERGHEVRAVTRNPHSEKAKALASAGATLVTASLEDTATLTEALEGATSLFAMTTPFGGAEAETRQGVSAAEAAKAAGVHLLFNSVGYNRVKNALLTVYAFRAAAAVTRVDVGLEKICEQRVSFRDELDLQTFPLPCRAEGIAVLEIIDVWPASRWQDTCTASTSTPQRSHTPMCPGCSSRPITTRSRGPHRLRPILPTR